MTRYLSEEAVLAFEYGYATTAPKGLIIWEAQFGDFANGAQVVIDQFIASGEHKWGRLSGLTMLLPHGFEGQGPEHSSARLERFLQLCAEHNMQVVNPTTPAQIFHLLRRQAIRPMRRPLVIMSPKWILRHKLATSSLEELAGGKFSDVMADTELTATRSLAWCSAPARSITTCLEERMARGIDNIALVRIEQLYPFPDIELEEALKPIHQAKGCYLVSGRADESGRLVQQSAPYAHVLQGIDPMLHSALCRSYQLCCTGLWLYVCALGRTKTIYR